VKILIHATPVATRDLGLHGFIPRTGPHVLQEDSNPRRKDHQIPTPPLYTLCYVGDYWHQLLGCSWYIDFDCVLLRLPNLEVGLTETLTRQQRMFTPPRHLIPVLVFSGKLFPLFFKNILFFMGVRRLMYSYFPSTSLENTCHSTYYWLKFIYSELLPPLNIHIMRQTYCQIDVARITQNSYHEWYKASHPNGNQETRTAWRSLKCTKIYS
jgi:hypothetical protein